MIDETFSHYRVLEEIGTGGMGVVYRAYDERLNRDVALKILSGRILADDGARRRFRREALSLAKLNHPNVGVIYDFDGSSERDFLVMEFVPGTALDRILSAGPLPEEEVLRLGVQLAAAMEASHAQGIIHRDLKPGNLRVTPDRRLKILDFGLAQWTPQELSHTDTTALNLSQPLSGTIPYMAPEQLRGNSANVHSDIYAAGVILYEMTTGIRPYAELSGPVLISAILELAPSLPRSRNPRISVALENIILKAMAKDAQKRYPSAEDLRLALERAGQSGVLVQRSRNWREILMLAGILLALILPLIWLLVKLQ